MSSLWVTIIAVGIPTIAGATGGLIKYTSLRARHLRVIDDEVATLNNLPQGTAAYVEMEGLVHRHVGEYVRAVKRSGGHGKSRPQVWMFNLGAFIGVACTAGGGAMTIYVVDGINRGSLSPIYLAGLVVCIIGTAFGVLMLTLVIMGALNRASTIAWAVMAAEDLGAPEENSASIAFGDELP